MSAPRKVVLSPVANFLRSPQGRTHSKKPLAGDAPRNSIAHGVVYGRRIAVAKLRPNERNSRTHPDKQIAQLAKSISQFGWTDPILVDESNVILAGHARHLAARQLGYREVPVIVVSGLNDAEKRALALADNKIASRAGWDRKRLAEELGELAELLPDCNLDLEITGFAMGEIDSLIAGIGDPELDAANKVPPVKHYAISKPGDLWELGPHRLVCGDAHSAPDVGLCDVDAAIVRWQEFTGRNAVLSGAGKTFDEVAAVRSTRGMRHG
jgi:hypothetical protein